MKNVAFERASELVASMTELTSPQARGTIRLGLKEAGLDARSVTARELSVVFKLLMPKRLQAQGVTLDQVQELCAKVADLLGAMESVSAPEAAASMFDRLDNAARKV